jgi:hypothetical protein
MILLIGNHCLKERAFSDKLLLMEGESANALIETVMVIHDLLIKAVAEFPPPQPSKQTSPSRLRVFPTYPFPFLPLPLPPFPTRWPTPR